MHNEITYGNKINQIRKTNYNKYIIYLLWK